MLMKAYFPALDQSLGIFIPLIVVNCVILGRAEAFASKNSILASIYDAIGMGLGFTLSLTLIALIREVLGAGTVMGIAISHSFRPVLIFGLAPGAFITMGFLLAYFNFKNTKKV